MIEPIYAGQFYKPPYRWWQLIKRYRWKHNKTVAAYRFSYPTTATKGDEAALKDQAA